MIVSRGIYWLPNLLTTAALFFGFLGVISGLHHHFIMATMYVYVGILFDGLDGRVARLTHTQSDFGVAFDSLSDLIVSGFAPALISYVAGLSSFRLGWVISFMYLAATALRLARFNTQVTQQDAAYFRGLPCPTAAAVVLSVIGLSVKYQCSSQTIGKIIACILLCTAMLMVSNFVYYSFKKCHVRERVPFFFVIGMMLFLGFVALNPMEMILLLCAMYTLSGPLLAIWRLVRSKKKTGC